MTKEQRAVAHVLIAGVSWGCIGIFTRYLSAFGMPTLAVAFSRSAVATVSLAVLFSLTDRSIFRIRVKDVWMFVGTGFISIGLFNVLYFMTQGLTTLSVAAVLLYTAPFFVIILSKLIFKERITRQKVVALLLAFTGCLFATGLIGGGSVGAIAPLAIATGIASGFTYALYSIFGRVALNHYGPMTVTFYSLLISALSLGIILLIDAPAMPMVQPKLILGILGLGIVSTALPYVFYTKGLSVLAPSKASVLAFIEPMTATVVGILIFHEPLTLTAALGIGLIFSGIIVLSRRDTRDE